MLHVIMVILKIIGILLLILLLALLAVLFVSVTCRIRAERREEKLSLCVTCGWLFRALTARFTLEQQESFRSRLAVRIFGITVWVPVGEGKKEPKPSKEKRPKKQKDVPKQEEAAERPEPIMKPDKPEPKRSESAKPAGMEGQKEKQEGTHKEAEPLAEAKIERAGFFRRLREKVRNIIEKLKKIPEFFRNIQNKKQELMDKKDFFLDFWNREEHVRARGAIWKEVLYLLKKIKPKKVTGYLHFGFADPSLTGKLYGAACVFSPWYPGRLILKPDFEQEVLEGQLYIYGRIRLCVLVGILVRLLLNKDARLMYRHWKER